MYVLHLDNFDSFEDQTTLPAVREQRDYDNTITVTEFKDFMVLNEARRVGFTHMITKQGERNGSH